MSMVHSIQSSCSADPVILGNKPLLCSLTHLYNYETGLGESRENVKTHREGTEDPRKHRLSVTGT